MEGLYPSSDTSPTAPLPSGCPRIIAFRMSWGARKQNVPQFRALFQGAEPGEGVVVGPSDVQPVVRGTADGLAAGAWGASVLWD